MVFFTFSPLAFSTPVDSLAEPCFYRILDKNSPDPDADSIRTGTLFGRGNEIEVYRYKRRLYAIVEIENGYVFKRAPRGRYQVRHRNFERKVYRIHRTWVDEVPVLYSSDYTFLLAYGYEFHFHHLDSTEPGRIPRGTVQQWQGYAQYQLKKPGNSKGLRHGYVPFAESAAGHFLLDFPERHQGHSVGKERKPFKALVPEMYHEALFLN